MRQLLVVLQRRKNQAVQSDMTGLQGAAQVAPPALSPYHLALSKEFQPCAAFIVVNSTNYTWTRR